jgi:hypothetical protein
VKRSGRDEPVWVVIYMYMEAMLRISLYNYLSQTSKNAMSFLLSIKFSLQQNWRIRVQKFLPGSKGGRKAEGRCIYI